MKIDNQLLEKLENLSYLKISDDKRENFIKDLNDIIKFSQNLNDISETNIKVSNTKSAFLREDISKIDVDTSKDILKNAPKQIDDFFIVDSVIE